MSGRTTRGRGRRAGLALSVTIVAAAHGDGGALVARGEVQGEAAAVFLRPVPPTVGPVEIEAVSGPWRAAPPRMRMVLGDRELVVASAASELDPLASVAIFDLPAAGRWRLTIETGEGAPIEAEIPIGEAPPPWRARLPWMLAWIPMAAAAAIAMRGARDRTAADA